jgi:hypothetical protein
MIQIGQAIVSLDIFECKFCCDLAACMGACCIEGDAGAPLTPEECQQISENYALIEPYMSGSGKEAVREQGFQIPGIDGEVCTSLVYGRECVFARFEQGNALCAIEKAWESGKISLRKPISCHLYPIRVIRLCDMEGLSYHRWSICQKAAEKGNEKNIPLYRFLKDPLIRKYGEDWYRQLEEVAGEIEKQGGIERIRER